MTKIKTFDVGMSVDSLNFFESKLLAGQELKVTVRPLGQDPIEIRVDLLTREVTVTEEDALPDAYIDNPSGKIPVWIRGSSFVDGPDPDSAKVAEFADYVKVSSDAKGTPYYGPVAAFLQKGNGKIQPLAGVEGFDPRIGDCRCYSSGMHVYLPSELEPFGSHLGRALFRVR